MMRKFTETIDLNTETGGPSVLGLHAPISGDAYRFLYPYFMAYKKYKYVGMDVTIVNAARLPYDPEQLGKVSGENYVDPRDALNPVLFRGCHGESLGAILDSIYAGLGTMDFKDNTMDRETLISTLENFYYTALGDPTWRKSPIQKTLSIRNLHPLVYNLGTNKQILPTNDMGASDYIENSDYGDSTGAISVSYQSGFPVKTSPNATTRPFVITSNREYDPTTGEPKYRFSSSLFTTGVRRLGWLDTLQIVGRKGSQLTFDAENIALLPKLFMGLLILPKANLVRNYLRVVITHKFKFAGYRSITTGGAFPDFDPNSNHYGYANHITGEVPSASSKLAEMNETLEPMEEDTDDEVCE